MSNLTLKEQLQSLGLSSAENEKPQPKKQQPAHAHRAAPKPTKTTTATAKPKKPAWLEQAQYGVELLKAHFPACFKEVKDLQPLKVGIKQDLVKHLGTREDIVISDKACMVNSLAYYVNSPAYHKRAAAGAVRIDLDGNPAGVVSAEEAQYSQDCRQAKLQKRKPAVPAVSADANKVKQETEN